MGQVSTHFNLKRW